MAETVRKTQSKKSAPIEQKEHTCSVGGTGSKTAEILFVGEATPTATEGAIAGQVFGDAPWRKFLDCLVEAGITRSEVYITNAVKCRQPNKVTAPTQKELEACRPNLVKEILEIKPKVIVPLGAVALKSILGQTGISRIHGNIISSEEFNCKIIPTFSPSYILRKIDDESVKKAFISDLVMVRKYLTTGSLSQERTPNKYHLIETTEQFNILMSLLYNAPVIDFDLETTSKNPENGRIICISFSTKEHEAFVVPLFTDKKEYWGEKHNDIMDALKVLFAKEIPKNCQAGALIDIPFLYGAGIDIKGWDYDTIIMHHLLDENAKSHGLKELAWEFTDMGGYDAEVEEWKNKLKAKAKQEQKEKGLEKAPDITFADIPFNKLWPYAAADADVAGRLRRVFEQKLKEQDLMPLFKRISMKNQKVLIKVERNGVKIDRTKLAEIQEEYEGRLKDIDMQLDAHPVTLKAKEVLKLETINYSSSTQLRKILFDIIGLIPTRKTKKTGMPSTDDESLKALASQHEIPRMIIQRRGYAYLIAYYGDKFNKAIRMDGRIHTNYFVYGTETGRLSSQNPNLQNIPRADETEDGNKTIASRIRDIFVAEEGKVLIDADYSQIEFRLLANYSKDTRMIYDITHDVDVHIENAMLVYDKSREQVTKQERQNAKALTYALIYGASHYRIADQFNISPERAMDIMEQIFRRYPGARDYHSKTIEMARTKGYVTDIFGRRRRLPGIVSPDKKIRGHNERSAINSRIQGLAGDLLYIAQIRLQQEWDKLGDKIKMVLTVHDSIVNEVPENDVNSAIATIYREMTSPVPGIIVPLEVEVKIGKSLGSMKKLSREDLEKIISKL